MKFQFFQVILACLLLSPVSVGQSKEKIALKAHKKYEQLGYTEAIELYQQGNINLDAMERIAGSYRMKGDSWSAARWYALVVRESTNPLNFLYYAQALQSNGDTEKAKEYYLKYNRSMGYNRMSDKRGQQQAAAIAGLNVCQLPSDIEVRNESAINSDKLDYSPAFFSNGIVFVSNRATDEPEKDSWTGEDYASLYYVPVNNNNQPVQPELFKLTPDSRFHNGPANFSRNGELAFLTKNHEIQGRKRAGKQEWSLKIYAANRLGDVWTLPVVLDLADQTANDVHPALSPDGMKLFFSSDRPGGYGGMDLYVASFRGGRWGHPVNLGPAINTAGNETFPFVADDGSLYFASDGWGGMGGLDIFYAEVEEGIFFKEAMNLGGPFNSPKDDFGFILAPSGKEGYFTSAREGGVGKDDIYHFTGITLFRPMTGGVQVPDFQHRKDMGSGLLPGIQTLTGN
jgi:hypothetical protein